MIYLLELLLFSSAKLLSKLLLDSSLWLIVDEYFKFSSFTSELNDEVENFDDE